MHYSESTQTAANKFEDAELFQVKQNNSTARKLSHFKIIEQVRTVNDKQSK